LFGKYAQWYQRKRIQISAHSGDLLSELFVLYFLELSRLTKTHDLPIWWAKYARDALCAFAPLPIE
jgi:hypothetical protein